MDGIAVAAEGLGLKGPRGWAFRGITFAAAPGSLVAVEGPSGTGRTCLLLALTGRMKATEGTATVGGARLPKQLGAVRRMSAVAHVVGVTDLDPALTVGEHLRERALLQRRFGDSLRALLRPARRARTRRGCASTPPSPPPVSTPRPCPRARGPPYAIWSGWKDCGCPSRSRSSGVRSCSASTTSI